MDKVKKKKGKVSNRQNFSQVSCERVYTYYPPLPSLHDNVYIFCTHTFIFFSFLEVLPEITWKTLTFIYKLVLIPNITLRYTRLIIFNVWTKWIDCLRFFSIYSSNLTIKIDKCNDLMIYFFIAKKTCMIVNIYEGSVLIMMIMVKLKYWPFIFIIIM